LTISFLERNQHLFQFSLPDHLFDSFRNCEIVAYGIAAVTLSVHSASTRLGVVDLARRVVHDHDQLVIPIVLKLTVLTLIDVQHHPRQ
jgi:hypothetical protein